MNRTTKRTRRMKVYEQSGYKYKNTPTIMLKGFWLREFGFNEGTLIQVFCEDGKLIITRVAELPIDTESPVLKVAEPSCG